MADLDLLVLGDANPDLVLRGGDVEPAFGQAERLVEEGTLTVGGSGAIAACAAARLGLRVGFAGVVGDDAFGRFMREELEARGVDTRGVLVDPARPTGVTVVLSRGDDRAILTAPGTVGDLRGSLVDPGLLAGARHVHVSSYFLQRGLGADLPELFDEARRAGGTTSVDPNWDPAERWDGGLVALLARTDVFFPNAAEVRAIARVEDVGGAAQRLAEAGPAVVVKLGAEGAVAATRGGLTRLAGPAVDVVDTTGAGDTFDAGYLAGHLAGWSVERCLALAAACGALSTAAAGGVAAQPTMDEAMALVDPAGGTVS